MKINAKKIICFAAIAAIVAVLIAGNIVCAFYARTITMFFGGPGVSFSGDKFEQAEKLGDKLCEALGDEGVILLKNENNSLPLDSSVKKLNVFGWSATDGGFLLSGAGSGSSSIQAAKRVTLLDALDASGYEYNTEIINMYKSYKSSHNSNFDIIQPPASNYTQSMIANAKEFSDTALVVISRYGGENIGYSGSGVNTEIPSIQPKYSLTNDSSRTYLQTTTEEDDMLEMVRENFDNVIAIINTCNNMHLGFLEDNQIDSALYVGLPGQSAARSIVKILKGEINPSGKTTDTYIYNPTDDPSWYNREKASNHIQYVEDIYFGYKWYETADEMKFFDGKSNDYGSGYDSVVQYPFGYGLSYTNFSWTVDEVSLPDGSDLKADSEITLTMSITNEGKVAGRDVIQVYYTPPYKTGGIEKAHMNLVGFAKSAEIAPGKTQQNIKISFTPYDMASYDCYDKNDNGKATYELDNGKYEIKIMKDAHTLSDVEKPIITYNVASDIIFDKDPVTSVEVKNHYTGDDAYAGVPIDGSTVGAEKNYLSRSDFGKTFPTAHAVTPNVTAEISKANNYTNTTYDQTEMPKVASTDTSYMLTVDGKFNNALVLEIGADYDDERWNDIVDQITVAELCAIVENSGFRTQAVNSVGKSRARDFDGPAGFNANVQSPGTDDRWTAYPSETLIGSAWSQALCYEMGLSMGFEAAATNISGWYAPGVNLHRTAYTARNFEYYGEDGFISGKLAAEVIRGAKRQGLYCYIKHYAVSEAGPNPRELNTWLTEQNLRENYLRPFEIAVKEGDANAIMTAFNRVGGTWAGASYPLNVSILREEWGFRGTVITDWSTGETYMNPEKGIRAGNDIWLNPNESNGAPISRANPTSIYCAKMAAKNMLYTYVNTYYYATVHQNEVDDRYTVELGVRTIEDPFPWWIIILVVVEVAVVGGLVFWVIKLVRPKKTTQAA